MGEKLDCEIRCETVEYDEEKLQIEALDLKGNTKVAVAPNGQSPKTRQQLLPLLV